MNEDLRDRIARLKKIIAGPKLIIEWEDWMGELPPGAKKGKNYIEFVDDRQMQQFLKQRGAKRIHLYPSERILAPRGALQKESLSSKIANEMIAAYKSKSDFGYRDLRLDVSEQVEEKLEERIKNYLKYAYGVALEAFDDYLKGVMGSLRRESLSFKMVDAMIAAYESWSDFGYGDSFSDMWIFI